MTENDIKISESDEFKEFIKTERNYFKMKTGKDIRSINSNRWNGHYVKHIEVELFKKFKGIE